MSVGRGTGDGQVAKLSYDRGVQRVPRLFLKGFYAKGSDCSRDVGRSGWTVLEAAARRGLRGCVSGALGSTDGRGVVEGAAGRGGDDRRFGAVHVPGAGGAPAAARHRAGGG